MTRLRLLFLVPVLLGLSACETLGYYGQALQGQLALMRTATPIQELLEDPNTETELRTQLRLVQELTAFASQELSLESEGQYMNYVDTGKPFVVWNVFATDAFSLDPHTWCYPIVGCAAYRGYFSRDSAEEFAGALAGEGLDTYVGGVAAYSTLGWISDPVLNTFVYRGEARLAELIFHELAHQVLYVAGDTTFNESFATATAAEGVRQWLIKRGKTQEHADFQRERRQREEFAGLVAELRDDLAVLFEEAIALTEMEKAKKQTIDEFREKYARLVQNWGGDSPFSAWVNGSINNAKLNSVAAYNQLVPPFEALLANSATMQEFFLACKALAELDYPQRQRALRELIH